LNLAGGTVVDIISGLIDPDDEVNQEKIDVEKYEYLECKIEPHDGSKITGDIGITNEMHVTVDAILSYKSTQLATLTGINLAGYTNYLSATGNTVFYPMYLNFGTVTISGFWDKDEYELSESEDLVLHDVSIMHKVINATTNTGVDTKYTVTANISFSDPT